MEKRELWGSDQSSLFTSCPGRISEKTILWHVACGIKLRERQTPFFFFFWQWRYCFISPKPMRSRIFCFIFKYYYLSTLSCNRDRVLVVRNNQYPRLLRPKRTFSGQQRMRSEQWRIFSPFLFMKEMVRLFKLGVRSKKKKRKLRHRFAFKPQKCSTTETQKEETSLSSSRNITEEVTQSIIPSIFCTLRILCDASFAHT